MIPDETRWNSHYFCFKSLIRSKQALRVNIIFIVKIIIIIKIYLLFIIYLFIYFQNLAIRYERLQIGSENTNELYLKLELCQILLNNDWWEKIELLQNILLPYCGFFK